MATQFGCSPEDEAKIDNSFAESKGVRYSRVNLDTNSPEIATIVSDKNDTVTYLGTKNSDGTVKEIEMMRVSTSEMSSIIRLDKSAKPSSIVSSNGVAIDFSWENKKTSVVKVYNPENNSYISTIWYVDSLPPAVSSKSIPLKAKNVSGRRGNMEMHINYKPALSQSRAAANEHDQSQSCTFNIFQCDYPINADNWIGLINTKENIFIDNIYYKDNPEKGVYTYSLPISSYPTEASNEELCKKIDIALTIVGAGISYLAAMESGLAVWLNYVAIMTGVGVLPAAVVNTLVTITLASNFTLNLISDAGGVENIMKSLNPEWYYKEYITSDITLMPAVFSGGKTHFGEKLQVSPDMDNIVINQNIEGNPSIDSFELIPSHPAAGESYNAIATFHCIPVGSSVKVSIVGTDGYTDSRTQYVNYTNGTATLYVPGAATGVYDLCTVLINTPEGKEYSMQASLVFGL